MESKVSVYKDTTALADLALEQSNRHPLQSIRDLLTAALQVVIGMSSTHEEAHAITAKLGTMLPYLLDAHVVTVYNMIKDREKKEKEKEKEKEN